MKMIKRIIGIILILCLLIALLPGTVFAESEMDEYLTHNEIEVPEDEIPPHDDGHDMYPLYQSEYSVEEYPTEGDSVVDIQQFLDDVGQLYQGFRVQYEDYGTITYRVPVQESEIEYLIGDEPPRTYTATTRYFTGLPDQKLWFLSHAEQGRHI